VLKAKRILAVKTETEAIVRSLEEVTFMDEVERAVRASAGRLPKFEPVR
jgi:hypothetical protein